MKTENFNTKFPMSKNLYFQRKAAPAIIRTTLLVASLSLCGGIGIELAGASPEETANPEPHSDGLGAAISDTAITAKVKAKFVGQDIFKNSDINVTTTNQVVTLEGNATNKEVKSLAGAVAETIDGVKV